MVRQMTYPVEAADFPHVVDLYYVLDYHNTHKLWRAQKSEPRP